jgi:hypothetical protein
MSAGATLDLPQRGNSMPKKPDYKREKKLREAAQRKRNEEAQQRKASRKSPTESVADHSTANAETP